MGGGQPRSVSRCRVSIVSLRPAKENHARSTVSSTFPHPRTAHLGNATHQRRCLIACGRLFERRRRSGARPAVSGSGTPLAHNCVDCDSPFAHPSRDQSHIYSNDSRCGDDGHTGAGRVDFDPGYAHSNPADARPADIATGARNRDSAPPNRNLDLCHGYPGTSHSDATSADIDTRANADDCRTGRNLESFDDKRLGDPDCGGWAVPRGHLEQQVRFGVNLQPVRRLRLSLFFREHSKPIRRLRESVRQ